MKRLLRVLIVEDQDETRSKLREAVKEVGLEPITRTRMGSSLDVFQKADMMIMNWHLPNGDPQELIHAWLRGKSGPVAVLYSEMPDTTQAHLLSYRLVWNVFPQPPRYDLLVDIVRTLLGRYTNSILVQDRLVELERRVEQQSLWLAGLAIAVIGLGIAFGTTLMVVLSRL